MGIDPGQMGYERLAQALPPAYTELIFGQMCMRAAHDQYGAPAITFDEMIERPACRARRELAAWLRGAGEDAPSAGLALVSRAWEADMVEACEDARAEMEEASRRMQEISRTEHVVTIGADFSQIREADFRELYYSHAGGYQQLWAEQGSLDWLSRLRRRRLVDSSAVDALEGRNTFVELRADRLSRALPVMAAALESGGVGTRFTVVASEQMEAKLLQAGFELLCRMQAEDIWHVESRDGERSTTRRVA